MGEVENLEGHYFELKGKLSTGAISPEEFRHQVARLWFEDVDGHTWMIGAHTGHWYVYKNELWNLAEPPREHALADTIACPRCGEHTDLHATFCGHCGLRLNEPEPVVAAPVGPARPAQSRPQVAAHAATPHLTVKAAPAQTVPAAAARRPQSRMILAASGALAFGLLFLCLASLGALMLLRNNNTPTSVALAVSTATPRQTQTPTASPAPSRTATAVVVATIAGNVTPIVPTPIVVFIVTSTPTPVQVVAQATTSTTTSSPLPAGSTAPATAATAAVSLTPPTGTATATPATSSDTPTPSATPAATDTPAPPTSTPTPRPTVNTPTPRPPTATPVPVVAMNGRIAFTIFNPLYNDRPAYDTYLTAVDGSGRQLIAPKRRQPQFSPDGSRLVTMGMEPEREKLFVRDLVNGGERPIENTPIEALEPSWSPDGLSVAYASAELDDRQSRLYTVDARIAPDSRQWLKFGNIDLVGRYPTWMTNGQIVYSGCDKWGDTGMCGIARVNPDGFSPVMLTSNERDGVDIAPSGRGNTVVYMSNRDGNWEVYSVPLSGGAAKNLTNHPGDDGLPTISPDGQFIAFVSNRNGQWAVWAMKVDGTGVKMLFNTDGGYGTGGTIDWSTERISWGP